MTTRRYNLIVVGAGAGGIGAAITGGRLGLRTLWIEKEARLGGTGVNAWVNVWQPSYTASRLAPEIARRLCERGEAIYCSPFTDTPTGRPIYRHDPRARYEATLGRWADRARGIYGTALVYTPSGMDALLREMAAETGKIEIADETVFLDERTAPSRDGMNRLVALIVQTRTGVAAVEAEHFVDATGDGTLAGSAGCAWTIGRESVDDFGEPSAPAQREFKLNGWTLCFAVREGGRSVALTQPEWGNESDWAHIGEMPGGGFYVNLCFQLPGEVGWMMGAEQAREHLLGNIRRRWPLVQKAYGLENYAIVGIAPRIGVREGPRLVGRYVLTELDFRAGRFGAHHEDCVAFTDHALDRHSPDGGCVECENGPMGIPFRCIQPRELDNLLVACRGASFSSLAASAARLQRNLMELGEAAAQFSATGKVPRVAQAHEHHPMRPA